MELAKEQEARNSAGSKKELEVNAVQNVRSSDDFELNEEQLNSTAGGVISPPIDGDGGIVDGGCTKPQRGSK